ncbi:type II toxin-antitoxin system HicB family antitoxin [Parafilimonas sp.]|uniref:type II toxin-antitoxin system HicB family antitoxin n=1 Tax=Parafilimonas sp. TaxID=1969739 RepID=UPI0039E331FC
MAEFTYKIRLQKEPEGGYTVTVPALPGCVTYGDDVDHAIEMAKEAVELYIESLVQHGEKIPTENNTLEYSLHVTPDVPQLV